MMASSEIPTQNRKHRPLSAPRGRGTHVAKHVPARKLEQARIERENALHLKKMAALRREPPSSFHAPHNAPKLTQKVKTAHSRTARSNFKGAAKPDGLCDTDWPQTLYEPQAEKARRDHAEVRRRDNSTIQRKLLDKYQCTKQDPRDNGMFNTDHVSGNKLGLRNPVLERPWTSRDVRGAHQLRLRLYDEDAPLQLHKQRATGVPKCMGMAQCAGCGTTSYYAADGVRLTPCQNCNKVYYCSETCREVDLDYHKRQCNFYNPRHIGNSTQTKVTQGSVDYWVINRGQQEGRTLLRDKDQLWPDGDATHSILRRVKDANRQEVALDRAGADVGKNCYYGLPGPRPCMTERAHR
mmetsp:Transcript_7065/g.13194  ORF Transcript_7065/g.13194 Transcript_7065/m.13194 type:complete len:352 (+) Transcript_7065:91-1146(+)